MGSAFSFTFHAAARQGSFCPLKRPHHINPSSTTTSNAQHFIAALFIPFVHSPAKSFACPSNPPLAILNSNVDCNGRSHGCVLARAACGKVSLIPFHHGSKWNNSNLAIYRTMTAAVLTTSICVHFGILPYTWFYFHYLEIFKIPPQIWRFFTSYLVTGPKLGIVMDTYFVYQYTSQLETAHPKFNRKEDFLWYLTFCSLVIIVSLPLATYYLPSILHSPLHTQLQ